MRITDNNQTTYKRDNYLKEFEKIIFDAYFALRKKNGTSGKNEWPNLG